MESWAVRPDWYAIDISAVSKKSKPPVASFVLSFTHKIAAFRIQEAVSLGPSCGVAQETAICSSHGKTVVSSAIVCGRD